MVYVGGISCPLYIQYGNAKGLSFGAFVDSIKLEVNMKKLISLIFTFFLVAIPTNPANAETAWRYWSYWQFTDGTWQMAMTGAADVKAEDGQVQGWRYITAGIEVTEEFAPRTTETFESICGAIAKTDGLARVALVVDFGDASDYSNPDDAAAVSEVRTECVEVTEGDPSSLLLSSAFETREESGMVCGVENLPSSGCGEEVELPAVSEEPMTTTAVDEAGGSQEENPLQSGAIQVLLLGAALVAISAVALKNRKQK